MIVIFFLYRYLDRQNHKSGELTQEYNLKHWEIQNLFEQLKNDEYINNSLLLSLKGSSFLEIGGCVQKYKNNKTSLTYQKLTNLFLGFGALSAGVYYIVELLKILCSVSR